MPPRREPPDLSIIAILQMMTPNDQLKAAGINPRWVIQVRAANRQVKTLVIITRSESFDVEKTKEELNKYSLASEPVMELLPADGETFPDYPMTTTRLSKWNCLLVNNNQLFDQATVGQIVNAFSAVTDLKVDMSTNVCCENLIALLQRTEWANQLNSLGVFTFGSYLNTKPRLVLAINGLSALQCLAMDWSKTPETLPELTILSQLKVIALDLLKCDDEPLDALLHSMERHAESNVDLQVYLNRNWGYFYHYLLKLSAPLSTRIVRFKINDLNYNYDDVPRLCRQFPSLNSLNILYTELTPRLDEHFTALSRLPHLVHLKLKLRWNEHNEQRQPFRRSMAQLTSVRALELWLILRSHSQWLNLPATLPRLQAIKIIWFHCKSCKVYLCEYLAGAYSENSNPSSSTALECLRATFTLLHPAVPHSRIILGFSKPYTTTLEQLLSPSSQ